jgi:WD40 repeat protein
LLTGAGLALLADSKGGVILWNTTTGAWSRLPAADAPRPANIPDGRWFAVAATPDASTIWAGGLAGHLHRFDRRDDGAYDEAPPVRIGEFVSCLLALPDGSIMVGGVNGQLVRVLLDGARCEFARRGGRIMTIAATSLDGETIVATGDYNGALDIWHADGRLMRRIEFDHGVVYSLAFSSDGERLLCGAGGSARIWPVRHQRVVELARERLR